MGGVVVVSQSVSQLVSQFIHPRATGTSTGLCLLKTDPAWRYIMPS